MCPPPLPENKDETDACKNNANAAAAAAADRPLEEQDGHEYW